MPEIITKIKLRGFQERLFDLLEDARHAKKNPFELKRIAESYLRMFETARNYEELNSTTREILGIYHPEIFKEAEPEQTQYHLLPKSSS